MNRAGKPFGTCVRLSAQKCHDRVKRATGWNTTGYPVKQAIAKEALWPVIDSLKLVREWPIMVKVINA